MNVEKEYYILQGLTFIGEERADTIIGEERADTIIGEERADTITSDPLESGDTSERQLLESGDTSERQLLESGDTSERQLLESGDSLEVNQKTENILYREPSIKAEDVLHDSYWSTSVLPLSYYLSRIDRRVYRYKASKAEEIDIFSIKPKKLSSLLTQLDTILLKNIKPIDLLTSNIPYLTNKNNGLINFISNLLNTEEAHFYFLKVLKYLLIEKNYNSAGCIKKAFLRHKVSKKILIKLGFSDSKDGIPPFEMFMKNLEDSNNNNTESTSLEFCKIVELLLVIQNHTVKIDRKREHFLLYNIWRNISEVEEKQEVVRDDYLYLFL